MSLIVDTVHQGNTLVAQFMAPSDPSDIEEFQDRVEQKIDRNWDHGFCVLNLATAKYNRAELGDLLDEAMALARKLSRDRQNIEYVIIANEVTEELLEDVFEDKRLSEMPVLSSLQAAYDFIERQ